MIKICKSVVFKWKAYGFCHFFNVIFTKTFLLNTELLISFVFATAALAISPGPDNIYVLMQSMVNGRASGLATVAGLISGCLVHTTLVAFGVSVLIKESDLIFLLLSCVVRYTSCIWRIKCIAQVRALISILMEFQRNP